MSVAIEFRTESRCFDCPSEGRSVDGRGARCIRADRTLPFNWTPFCRQCSQQVERHLMEIDVEANGNSRIFNNVTRSWIREFVERARKDEQWLELVIGLSVR